MTASAPPPDNLSCLPLLADPDGYSPCMWDMATDATVFQHWLGVFQTHFPLCMEEAVKEGLDRGEDEQDLRLRAEQCQSQFHEWLGSLADEPRRLGSHTVMTFCIERERTLRRGRFDDPYRLVKEQENQRALAILPALLAQLDAMDPAERAASLVEGVFAGNIFDLGAVDTAGMFSNGQPVDFHAVRGKLSPRPWLVDDIDEWSLRIASGPTHRCALMFVDNAGPDIVLGMIPFARDLLQRGTRVILTANLTPSLNDITHDELTVLVETIAGFDPTLRHALANGRLELVSSGNGLPLIDLSRVSDQLCEAVRRRGVDLVAIEGMGRALESNYDARFNCDAMKLGMIKDPGVAEVFGGKLYDLVFRFEPA